ncbi:MAG: hypothetical protein OXC48_02255 [Endozoicomonadaceae bacterium]|nr:hypothetical protein [Endozoicomonadaceae bacterium]
MEYCLKFFSITFLLILITFSAQTRYIEGQVLVLIKNISTPGNMQRLKEFFRQNPEAANAFMQDDDKTEITPLVAAVLYSNNIQFIRFLVQLCNADVNYILPDGRTALSVSLRKSSREITKFLYDEGAHAVNVVFNRVESWNRILNRLTIPEEYSESLCKSLEQDIKKNMTETEKNQWDAELQTLEKSQPKQKETGKKDKKKHKKKKGAAKDQQSQTQPADSYRTQRLQIMQQQLSDLTQNKDINKEKVCDGESFFLYVQKKTSPEWQLVNKSPFMLMIFPNKKQHRYRFSAAILEKYIKTLFIIYDMLYLKSANTYCSQVKELIEKTQIREYMVKAYQALIPKQKGATAQLELDIDTFKQKYTEGYFADNPKLQQYIESAYTGHANVLPINLEVLAHIYVWLGGQFGGSHTIASILENAGVLDCVTNHLQLRDNEYHSSILTVDLIRLIDDVKTKYPGLTEEFIDLIKRIYAKKAEILAEIMGLPLHAQRFSANRYSKRFSSSSRDQFFHGFHH